MSLRLNHFLAVVTLGFGPVALAQPVESTSPPPEISPSGAPAPAPETAPVAPAAAAAAEATPEPNLPPDSGMTPSQSVTINLINKLVQRGILTKDDAAEIVKQAEAEAAVAKEQAQADMVGVAQAAVAQMMADGNAVDRALNEPITEAGMTVTYIPEPVKTQLKEDIKLELATERYGPGKDFTNDPVLPGWISKVHPFMDLRIRYEGDFFPGGNDDTGAFPNFNAINTGAPFDTSGNQFPPSFNVDQNRERFRFRARFGAEIDLAQDFSMGLRIATGENNSPVTTNQTLGLANQGQGGNFSRYAIWLDRAFLQYETPKGRPLTASFWVGRFDNPFFSTALIWDDDVGFDGIAFRVKYALDGGFTPFLVGGAFPVFNTDFNFSSNQPSKFQSDDKYLFAIQGGFVWKPSDDWTVKLGSAYYYFDNVQGKLSSPYSPRNSSDAGNTDNSRPSFAQKGNTYRPIRNIVPDASNDFGAKNQFQYYGLATKFEEVSVTGRIDYNGYEPVQVSFLGEFVQNLAFQKGAINRVAVNNRAGTDNVNTAGGFEGSPTAWLVDLRVGTPSMNRLWDWGLTFGYRWIGSDAVVDGFNDSDFGLGGTNTKGFTVGGQMAVTENVWLSLRWMGAESLAGPQFDSDIVQFDLNAKF